MPALGHPRGKFLFRSRHAFGNGNAGIIGRLDHGPVHEVDEPDIRIHVGIHGGTAREVPPRLQAFSLIGNSVSSVTRAGLQGLEHHDHGHQLAHAGRLDQLVGVLLEEHGSRLCIDQNGVRRRGFKRQHILAKCGPGHGKKHKPNGSS